MLYCVIIELMIRIIILLFIIFCAKNLKADDIVTCVCGCTEIDSCLQSYEDEINIPILEPIKFYFDEGENDD